MKCDVGAESAAGAMKRSALLRTFTAPPLRPASGGFHAAAGRSPGGGASARTSASGSAVSAASASSGRSERVRRRRAVVSRGRAWRAALGKRGVGVGAGAGAAPAAPCPAGAPRSAVGTLRRGLEAGRPGSRTGGGRGRPRVSRSGRAGAAPARRPGSRLLPCTGQLKAVLCFVGFFPSFINESKDTAGVPSRGWSVRRPAHRRNHGLSAVPEHHSGQQPAGESGRAHPGASAGLEAAAGSGEADTARYSHAAGSVLAFRTFTY